MDGSIANSLIVRVSRTKLLLVIPIGLALELPSPSVASAVDDLIQRARSATDAGMASLWLGQVYDLDALTALAVIARHVSDVALGSAVTTIHSPCPARPRPLRPPPAGGCASASASVTGPPSSNAT